MFLAWFKPEGGEEIIGYDLIWESNSDSTPEVFVQHTFGITFYNISKTELLPGEKYNITIHARNTAGYTSSIIDHKTSKILQ